MSARPDANSPIELEVYHPERPAPVHILQEEFLVCPNENPEQYVCMTVADAKKILQNKKALARWVREAQAVLDFYEREHEPDPANE